MNTTKQSNLPPAQAGFLLAWTAVSCALLMALPILHAREPLWVDDSPDTGALYLVGMFLAASIGLIVARLAGLRIGAWRAALCMVAIFSLTFLFFLLSRPAPTVARSVLATQFASAVLLAALGFSAGRWRAPLFGLLCITLAGLVSLEVHRDHLAALRKYEVSSTDIKTGSYLLHAVTYRKAVAPADSRGGGIALLGSDYLLATGDGRLFLFNFGEAEHFYSRPLPYRIPVNIEEFDKDAGAENRRTRQFRVTDIQVQDLGDRVRILASHHYWKSDKHCLVVRVSALTGTRASIVGGDAPPSWTTVFESDPCLSLQGEASVSSRLAVLDPKSVLLALGDARLANVEASASYGRSLLIHLDGGKSEPFGAGLRNPQGMYVTPQREIWSTDDRPQGGDELHHLARGSSQEPAFTWIPSIGVSNLIRIERDRFPLWQGDFLVASLHAHSLFRIRVLGERVVFSEPIEVGARVRDLIEGPDGRVVLWTDAFTIVSLTPQ